METQIVDQVLVREIKKNIKEVRRCLFKMVMDRWVFLLFSFFFVVRIGLNRGSHPRSSNYCVCDGEVYTHSPVARTFSGVHTLRVHFAHSYACYTHAWLKGVCSAHVVISLSSHLLSLFMFHPSLLLLFLDGSLRDHSRLRPYRLWRPWLPAEPSEAHSARGRAVLLPGQVPSPPQVILIGDFVLHRGKHRKHAIGKPLKSMKSQRNSIRSHSLTTHREFDSDDRDHRGHLKWRV